MSLIVENAVKMTLIIITTTGLCNLNCSYCGGSLPPSIVPIKETYDLQLLIDFIRKMRADVAFYGGEPLINSNLIMRVMDELGEGRHYIIQTNGTLFENLPLDYWLMFDTILLSIDGREYVNDHYRGKGNYKTVLRTAKLLRSAGYDGDLIARMTLWYLSDVYLDVTHLLNLGIFDHVHWQLNVIWTDRWNFIKWAKDSYLPGIRRLISLWIREMEGGRILGIVPFLGVMKVALFGEWRSPPCGAGKDTFTVLPNGKIIACPIAIDSQWAYVGSLMEHEIRKVEIGEPCTSCEYFRYCGGRCLYAYKERLWGEEGFKEVCYVTKETIKSILDVEGEVRKLIEEGRVDKEGLYYPPYDNTTEVIP